MEILTSYSAIDELMGYFNFIYFGYVILVVVVFINAIKAFVNYRRKFMGNKGYIFDVISSIVSGLALGGGTVFAGILTDISTKYGNYWFNRFIILDAIALILFIVQLFLIFKREK